MMTNDVTINPILDLSRIADLSNDPEIKTCHCKDYLFSSWTVKIINHTGLDVKLYDEGDMYINDKFKNRISDDCELIFFRLKTRPNIICVNKKSFSYMKHSQFFLDINEGEAKFEEDTKYKLYKMSQETPKIEILTHVLFGMRDNGSFLSTLPTDILIQINHQYDQCIQSREIA